MILVNGKIYTMDDRVYEAIAVSGNRIALLGTTEEIEAAGTDDAVKIDLLGKSVFPGFIDSHMHFIEFGLCFRMVNLEEANSVEDVIERCRNHIRKNKQTDGWILGYGWNENRFRTHVMPTKHDLDKITTDLPILLTRVCEHIASVNSKALEMTGADKKTIVKGGFFDRGDDGDLNGVIRENAMDWLTARLPARSIGEIKNAISAAAREVLRYGVTSVHTSDLHSCNFEVMYESYKQLKSEGLLPVRINEQLYLPDLKQLEDYLSRGFPPGDGDDFFRLGPVKLLVDGCWAAEPLRSARTTAMIPGTAGCLFTNRRN